MCSPMAVITGGSMLLSYFGAQDAAAQASRDSANAQRLSAEQLAFQKQQYQDWQDVYGPIQKNLSSFFQGLSAESFTASGLTNLENQHNANMQQLETSFAQRGVDSAAQDFMRQNASLGLAESKAQLRSSAPLQLAQAQQSFLSNGVMNPGGPGVASALGQQASNFQASANANAANANAGYQAVAAGANQLGNIIGKNTPGTVKQKIVTAQSTAPNTVGGLQMTESLPNS